LENKVDHLHSHPTEYNLSWDQSLLGTRPGKPFKS